MIHRYSGGCFDLNSEVAALYVITSRDVKTVFYGLIKIKLPPATSLDTCDVCYLRYGMECWIRGVWWRDGNGVALLGVVKARHISEQLSLPAAWT